LAGRDVNVNVTISCSHCTLALAAAPPPPPLSSQSSPGSTFTFSGSFADVAAALASNVVYAPAELHWNGNDELIITLGYVRFDGYTSDTDGSGGGGVGGGVGGSGDGVVYDASTGLEVITATSRIDVVVVAVNDAPQWVVPASIPAVSDKCTCVK
jgi:hypothetical protein